jgi:hypothetical protein
MGSHQVPKLFLKMFQLAFQKKPFQLVPFSIFPQIRVWFLELEPIKNGNHNWVIGSYLWNWNQDFWKKIWK